MLDGVITSLTRAFREGISILLITSLLALAGNRMVDSGKGYVKIGEQFSSKRGVAVFLIAFTLAGGVISGTVRPIITEALADWRIASSAFGLLLLMILTRTNNQADNWNINDGRRETNFLIATVIILLVGPWIIADVQRIVSQVIDSAVLYLLNLINSVIASIIGFAFSLPWSEIGLLFLIAVLFILLSHE